MRINLTFRLVAASVMTILSACHSSSTQPQFPERKFTGAWSMGTNALNDLKMRVNAISVGDDITHVVKTVGIPDRDFTINKNEKLRFFTYYVYRQKADSPVESDKLIIVAFNKGDKVKGIYSNVEGVPNKNWSE